MSDLNKHRRECPDRDKYACDACSANGLREGSSAVVSDPKRRKLSSVASTNSSSPAHQRYGSPAFNNNNGGGGKLVHGSTAGLAAARGRTTASRPVSAKISTTGNPNVPDLKCRVCGKVYPTAEQLKLHLIGVHLGSAAFTGGGSTATVPVGATIITDAGAILQAGGEPVQIIASGSSTTSTVVGQWGS
jgi:hypothetical protein